MEKKQKKHCKYCGKEIIRKDYPVNFERRIACNSKECQSKRKEEYYKKKHCKDCGKLCFGIKCRECFAKKPKRGNARLQLARIKKKNGNNN